MIRTPRRVVRALRERERLVRFLRYVVDLQGWIADDPFTVDTDDIIRAEAYGWWSWSASRTAPPPQPASRRSGAPQPRGERRMSSRPREAATVAIVQAPAVFCPRKLAPKGPNVKRYMSTGPLAGYIIACPSCGFREMHMNERLGFVEEDGKLVSASGRARCMVCGLFIRVHDGQLSAEREGA